jgi:hypothetical protein
MNTTARTVTAADVQAFAEMVRPYFNRLAGGGLDDPDRLTAAVLIARRHEECLFADVLGSEGSPGGLFEKFVAALGGTYDEFRSEPAGA